MSRIQETFGRLREQGRKGLVGFMVAGDPDMERSEINLRALLDGGVDILELGMPFSDPTADGPVIQSAALRALESGTDLRKVLELVRRLRKDYQQPIVLFGYLNPLYKYGYENVFREIKEAGADGVLLVDLPYEENSEIRPYLEHEGLDLVALIAPTTDVERAEMILKNATGFVYYISVTGVTGQRVAVAGDLAQHVNELCGVTALPVAVGFGISNKEQACEVARYADAVVVGSAFVKASINGVECLKQSVVAIRQGLDEGADLANTDGK